MQVRMIRDGSRRNPLFDPAAAVEARRAGKPYEHSPDEVVPAGTIIDHPDAHYLCQHGPRNSPPKAEPVDDAALAKHAIYLQRRADGIEHVRAVLRNPPKDKKLFAHYVALAKTYGIETSTPPPEKPAK